MNPISTSLRGYGVHHYQMEIDRELRDRIRARFRMGLSNVKYDININVINSMLLKGASSRKKTKGSNDS